MRINFIILLSILIFTQSCNQKDIASIGNKSQEPHIDSLITQIDTSTLYSYKRIDYKIDSGIVKQNQGLTHILPKFGISQSIIFNIAERFDSIFDVKKILPDKKYYMICKKDSVNSPICFIYEKTATESVIFNFKDSLNVEIVKKSIDIKIKSAGGEINSSLWNAFIENDLSGALVMEVAKLYAWTIDFFGIQKGDNFKIIYEAKYVENKFIGIGEIKAILFNHRGKDFYSFKYDVDTLQGFAYYNEEGQSMKKALLSAPLEYVRISSKFSNRRLHPIKKVYRPHHGVDYAAPRGTDVVATGDGLVTFAGTSGGAGKMIKVKHSVGNILTKYLHLYKYAKGIKKGTYVKQGQKIGEVGSTGMSTGPHLDYRIYINGKAVDPLGIDIPSADPISKENLSIFKANIKEIKTQLDNIEF